jgi:hypothetical protein
MARSELDFCRLGRHSRRRLSRRTPGSRPSAQGFWYWGPECNATVRFLTFFILPLFALDLLLERSGDEYLFESKSINLRVLAGFAIMILVTFFSANRANAFIYFQF